MTKEREKNIHATLYLTGPGEAVLRDLDVIYQGKRSERERYEVYSQGNFHRLPSDAVTLRTTSLLNDESRAELGQLLVRLATLNPETLVGTNLQDWLDQSVVHPVVRQFVEAGARLATYRHAPQLLDAGVALEFVGKRPDALRIDGGWQTLVDGLATTAREAGAQLETGVRVVAIETGQESHLIRLANGSAFQANAVVMALPPALAAQLVINGPQEILHSYAEQAIPLYAACLERAEGRAPNPERFTVLHLDRSLFYANHARNVRLAPEGGALLHLIKYLGLGEKNHADDDRAEMEAWLDQLQGAAEVIRYLLAIVERISRETKWSWKPATVNGQPGIVVHAYGRVDAIVTCELLEGHIQEIDVIVNPDKLHRLQ